MRGSRGHLAFDADVEAFRSGAEAFERPRSSSHVPEWARPVLDGDHFVVNGQKVWTSGAHGADVLLTFVRTDPKALQHKGISVLLIPTDTPGVVRRPFASICDSDEVGFNEVFFTDARVPAENLVGELNDGWRVATGSLGHERVMLRMGYVDLLHELSIDFVPSSSLERDR